MENNTPDVKQKPIYHRYYYSFDTRRVICILLLIFAGFDLPLPLFPIIRPYLNAATGVMFTLYGFVVLRDGADLRKNIKHAAKVFAIMFVIYWALTLAYLWFLYGQPFAYLTKRGIFNFVVLNYWEPNFCSTIWYVQSTLYALIVLWLLRRFKKYDWLLCIVLFVISVVIGELSRVINFHVLGYNYIPGNFLTRTIPYMLLGRLIYRGFGKVRTLGGSFGSVLIAVGLFLSIFEYFLLGYLGKLGYTNHFAGFILISAGVCLRAIQHPSGGRLKGFSSYAKRMYKPMYFIYNPLANILLLAAGFVFRTEKQFSLFTEFLGFITAIIVFALCFLISKLKLKKKQGELAAERAEIEAIEAAMPKRKRKANLLQSKTVEFDIKEHRKHEESFEFEVEQTEHKDESFEFEVEQTEHKDESFEFEVGQAAKKEDTSDFNLEAKDLDSDERLKKMTLAAMGQRRRHRNNNKTERNDTH